MASGTGSSQKKGTAENRTFCFYRSLFWYCTRIQELFLTGARCPTVMIQDVSKYCRILNRKLIRYSVPETPEKKEKEAGLHEGFW